MRKKLRIDVLYSFPALIQPVFNKSISLSQVFTESISSVFSLIDFCGTFDTIK